MKCLYHECEKAASYPYPACSMEHGQLLKQKKGLVQSFQQEGLNGLTGYGRGLFSEMSINELMYYSQLI